MVCWGWVTTTAGEEFAAEMVATTWPGEGTVLALTCTLVIRRVCEADGPGTVKETPENTMELLPVRLPRNRLTLEIWEEGGGSSISNWACMPLATVPFRLTWISVMAVAPAVPPVQVNTRSPTCSAAPLAGMFTGAGLEAVHVKPFAAAKENFARNASRPPWPEV